jgi:hypothetical protein
MTGGMDIAPVIIWAAGITTLLNLANMLWTIFSGPTRKLSVKHEETERRLVKVEHDLHRLRDRIDQMPNSASIQHLEISLARMEGNINVLSERLIPVAAIADKMQELMLHQGKG